MQMIEERRPRQRSARRRKRSEVPLKNERVPGGNRKPLKRQTLSLSHKVKGGTGAKLSDIWPSVNIWRSMLGE